MHSPLTFLLCCAGCDDDDITLAGFGVLCGSHACAGVAVVGGIAEVLDLGVTEFGFGVNEQDFAGDLVVLDGRRTMVSGCVFFWFGRA